MKHNLFIAMEGIDGSGKTTQARLLANNLADLGYKVHQTFEPTQGEIGQVIRKILKGEQKKDERIIAGLFVADRLDHLLNEDDGIVKKTNEGFAVVCDRYCFSSYAYQGTYMDMDWVIAANAMSAQIMRPDINVFIDVLPEVCMERINANRGNNELYETLDNLTAVRQKFFEAFEKMKGQENILVIDGNRSPEVVATDVLRSIERRLLLLKRHPSVEE